MARILGGFLLAAGLLVMLAGCPSPAATPAGPATPRPPAARPTATPLPTPLPTYTPAPAPTPTPTPQPLSAGAASAIASLRAADELLALRLSRLPWVLDGMLPSEESALAALSSIAGNDLALAHRLARFGWMVAGPGTEEVSGLQAIEKLSGAAPELARQVTGYGWMADGLSGAEYRGLEDLAEFAERDAGLAVSLAGGGWMADGLAVLERAGLRWLGELSAVAPEVPGLLAAYPWVADGLADEEWNKLIYLTKLFIELAKLTRSLPVVVAAYPWLADGVTEVETHDLNRLVKQMESAARSDTVLAVIIAGHSWLADGITGNDWQNAIHIIYRLVDMAYEDRYVAREIASYSWVSDGLDEDELAFLSMLEIVKRRSLYRFTDLLETHHTRSATVELPLAGEVELLVFRHSPFPEDDDSIELLQEIIPVLEEFMGIPFPRRQVALWVIEPSFREGSDPPWIRGFAGADVIAVNARKHNPGFHLGVFHEAAHIYWGGHTRAHSWFIEGAAGFLPDYARAQSAVQSIEERREELLPQIERDCTHWGVNNIRQLLALETDNPEEYDEREICKYELGEFFHMEVYRLLGHDAFSAAMRQLYVDAENTGSGITESEIYQAFLDQAPEGMRPAFHELYCRLHGNFSICGE